MSFRIIQLENLDISVEHYKDNLKFSFFDAYVKKTMEDAEQKTLWHQDGEIIFKNYDYDIDKSGKKDWYIDLYEKNDYKPVVINLIQGQPKPFNCRHKNQKYGNKNKQN